MKVNQLKAGAALSYLSMGLSFVVSMVYTPFMLRTLGQSEYGLYNLVASVVSYLGLISFGFGSAYVRFFSRYKVQDDRDNIAKLNGMYLIIFTIIGLVSILAGAFLIANLRTVLGEKLTQGEIDKAKVLMAIMVINIAIMFPTSVFSSYITANERFVFQKIRGLVQIVINPLLMLPILLMGYGSVGLVMITFVLNLSFTFINARFCLVKLRMRFRFDHFDMALMKELTVFSSYMFLNMIVDRINWSLDKYLLGRFQGTISVAVYGVAATINTHYLSLSTAISHVFVPRVNQMVAARDDNKELTRLFTRVGRIQFFILGLICMGIIFFGKPFITLWAGPEYGDTYYIALLLILPVTIPLIQNIGIEIQKAKNMHQFRSVLYLIIAIANVLISIPLTIRFGGIGAAAGTAISLLLGNGLYMNWYYHKKVGLDIVSFWKGILALSPSLMIPIVVGILIGLFVNLYSIINLILFGLLFIVIYSFSLWKYGMKPEERSLFSKPFGRVRNKLLRK